MMERKIFITLGKLTTLIHLTLPFIIWGSSLSTMKPSDIFAKYGLYYLILIVYYFIMLLICAFNDIHSHAFWFFAPSKRIFHADAGEFWASFDNNPTGYNSEKKVDLFKQRWLYLVNIGSVEYTDNQDILVSRIKSEIDRYNSKNVQKKHKSKSVLDNWDGYVDDKSRREDRLNQIGFYTPKRKLRKII